MTRSTPRRLTADEVLRLTLARQNLDRRMDAMPPAPAVERFGPLHAADRATPYLSLLARIETFRFVDLDKAWLIDRQLDRRSAMRGTFHLIPLKRAHTIVCVVGFEDPAHVRYLRLEGVTPALANRLRKAVESIVAERGTADIAVLKRELPEPLRAEALAKTKGGSSTLSAVVRWMAEGGFLAAAPRRDPRTGALQEGWSQAPLVYERFESAFGKSPPCRQPEADADLARWYFAAHGPAAFEDWAWWNGLPAARSKAAFEAVRDGLEELAVDDWPPLFAPKVAPDEADTALRHSKHGPTVRLVPYEESAIKAYRATRQRYFGAGVSESAHTIFGEVLPTILVDGRVAGTWSPGAGGWSGALTAAAGKKDRGLSAELFGRADPAVKRALDHELDRVRDALAVAARSVAKER